jgi:hypothetical protein
VPAPRSISIRREASTPRRARRLNRVRPANILPVFKKAPFAPQSCNARVWCNQERTYKSMHSQEAEFLELLCRENCFPTNDLVRIRNDHKVAMNTPGAAYTVALIAFTLPWRVRFFAT